MKDELQRRMPHYSSPHLTGLVPWVYGTIMAARGCQKAVVSSLMTLSVSLKGNSLRQHPREWLYDGSDHPRPRKTELDVDICFGPLLAWVMALWQTDKLALAIPPA